MEPRLTGQQPRRETFEDKEKNMTANFNMRKMENRIDSTNPLSHRIVDIDCTYADGKFFVKSLPSDVPGLFTIRFTAPADFSAGDVFAVNDQDLLVTTRIMERPDGKVFAEGAVVLCDVDMDRNMLFITAGDRYCQESPVFQTGNLVYYVDPNGNDSIQTTGSADDPYKSLNGAFSFISQKIIPTMAGSVTIKVNAGSYAAESIAIDAGKWALRYLLIEAADPANKPVIAVTGSFRVYGGKMMFRNMRFETETGFIADGAVVTLDNCYVKISRSGCDLLNFYRSSNLVVSGTLEIDGSGLTQRTIIMIQQTSSFHSGAVKIIYTNIPQVEIAGLCAAWNSHIVLNDGVVFSGSFAGRKYSVEGGAVLWAANRNAIPGSLAGVVSVGGVTN